jgi:Bacterial protein of unknown function (DUF885)
MARIVLLLATVVFSLNARAQDSLDKLATDFWGWRTQYQPFNNDDIPRIERPAGLKRSWSAAAVARQGAELAGFESRWKSLDATKLPRAQQVDYRLIGSALARAHWELDINRRWQRDPTFYIDQTLTAVTEMLLPPPPFDERRSRELIARLQNIPDILEDAEVNLQQPAGPFARLAIDLLANIRQNLELVAKDVSPMLAGGRGGELGPAMQRAASALESYRAWLQQRLPKMTEKAAVGREAYAYFFNNVALYPFTPQQLLELSRQEWARSVAFEHMEKQRNRDVPALKMFVNVNEQIKATREMEEQVRRFLRDQGLLTVPTDFPHYTIRALPEYLAVLGDFGEQDDFTGPSRLTDNCIRWVPDPSASLGYFAKSNAHDPRPDLVHEGVPGHYLQLWLGWRNSDPIRQHYYDSGANEGLGFYAEEMMLQAGLFDDSPRSREIIYNYMRLRALRVEVDVKLALGEFTLDQAANYLSRMVPMDEKTAHAEASMFATQPGQAISYQAGKLQITRFLADARLRAGDKFDLRAFHDFVWKNGNVPIVLQEREWFGEEILDSVRRSSGSQN